MTLEDRIARAEDRFFSEHLKEATVIVMRPEIRAELANELHKTWEFDLNSYMGLTIAVSADQNFPDFKLACW